MAKIGLFGGTFDPPHTEHVNIVSRAMGEFGLSRVIVLPSGAPPHKEGVTEKRHRYRMAELAFSNLSGVTLDRYETDREGESYTVDTLEHFAGLYGGEKPYFILGGDSYRDLNRWRQPERIRELCRIIVVPRAGAEADCKGALTTAYRGREVSSTRARVMLEFGLPQQDVPAQVMGYIRANRLYRRFERYLSELRARVKPSRYLHSAHVTVEALELNRRHRLGIDPDKVFLAAALHDVAKYLTLAEAKAMGLDTSGVTALPLPVQHSYLGAALCAVLFPELDREVLNAVRYHTTFRAGMTQLDKIVALADGIEPGRNYPGVNQVRRAAKEDLDLACTLFLEQTLKYLCGSGKRVAPDTAAALRQLKEERK